MCGGENGLYETKLFYFKRPDDPRYFYSEYVSEYGDWCDPVDQIYMPECPECRRMWRSGEYHKLIIKRNDIYYQKQLREQNVIRYKEQLKKSYEAKESKLSKIQKDFMNRKIGYDKFSKSISENNEKHDKKKEQILKNIKYHQSFVDELELKYRQFQDEIEFYISPINHDDVLERWKSELIETFYGLD